MQKPPIEQVLRHYGAEFVPTGHRWRPMLCVLHDESRPSASVNTDDCKYKCYVCDFSGDSLDLIAEKEGHRDFVSSIEFAERVFGGEYGNVLQGNEGHSRRRVPFESGPVSGQRAILPTRVRRKPFTGA